MEVVSHTCEPGGHYIPRIRQHPEIGLTPASSSLALGSFQASQRVLEVTRCNLDTRNKLPWSSRAGTSLPLAL